jgi:hypothetical protein
LPVRHFVAALLVSGAACGTGRLEQRQPPAAPFDAVVVPGCPSEADGALSRCQMARALWAARLWDLGWAHHFIVSGAAVHSPYVEAEALAEALAALGVPSERIYLEPNALHTDENMYYSLQIARALGFARVAVAGDGARWDCRMLLDWGQPCRAFSTDLDWVRARHRAVAGMLERVRTPPVARFVPLDEREREIARLTGRHRPPSYLLYLSLGLLRLNGERWIPPAAPAEAPIVSWAKFYAGRSPASGHR